jgi:hypothetical protein
VSRRSFRAGVLAAAGLGAFYAGVIAWASGVSHLADQAGADWPYLAAIVAGFAVQVALLVELRHRRQARAVDQAAAGAGAGASAVGMVACCAHHLADLAPVVGVSAAAAFLTDWRIEFMLAGIAVNALGVAVAAHRLWADVHTPRIQGGAAWHTA